MKKIALLSIALTLSLVAFGRIAFAFQIPERPQGFVSDYAGIFSGEERNSLENKISAFEKSTGNEIAVVIIPSLDGDTIENLAQEIFTNWGIGKKGKDNGILVLVAMAERKTRIQTGYGVEGGLTDLSTSYIQSEVMAPAFKNGDYYVGISGTVDKIVESLAGKNIVPENYSGSSGSKINFEFIFLFGFILLQWLAAVLGRSKSWWAGGVLGALVGGVIWFFGSLSVVFSIVIFIAFVLSGLAFDFVVSRAYQKIKNSGRRGHFPWWLGGGGFGGRNGGGFGGFGGGMSGGGGSSGSW